MVFLNAETACATGLLHKSYDIERLFESCFLAASNTLLWGGADEPLYLPAEIQAEEACYRNLIMRRSGTTDCSCNLIFYREDYFASALHEVAHWCIAGASRRNLVDFGYWYEPEGRSNEQQEAFFRVEVKPQALELLFSLASGWPFQVSLDNFSSEVTNIEALANDGVLADDAGESSSAMQALMFETKVYDQARCYLINGLPEQAEQFMLALAAYYHVSFSKANRLHLLDDWRSQIVNNRSEKCCK